MIYFDNAATTLRKPESVIEAVCTALRHSGNAARSAHGPGRFASRILFDTRRKLSDFFGGFGPEQVVFTHNSTEALNIAINGILEPGDHVITTVLEHNSVLRPLYHLRRERGISVDFVPFSPEKGLDYQRLERLRRPETAAIICNHASNVNGYLTDISFLGDFSRKHGLLFILDASQTAGVFPLHCAGMNIDVLCFTGHKGLYGPQGTGGLVLRDGIHIRPLIVGGTGIKSQSSFQPDEYPVRLEAGTRNAHDISGLSAALDFITETGMDAIRRKETELAARFFYGIRSLRGIRFCRDICQEGAAIVAFTIEGIDPALISELLGSDYEIITRAGLHCAPLMHKALGTERTGSVRFSFSYFNTQEEVDAAINALKDMEKRQYTL